MKFTRRQIIAALRTEPLEAGQWIKVDDLSCSIDFEDNIKAAKSLTNCTVCAVGSVLRKNTTLSAKQITQRLSLIQAYSEFNCDSSASMTDIVYLLKNEDYLMALSAYFESTIPDKARYGKRHRERLVKFVKDNFPTQIEIAEVW